MKRSAIFVTSALCALAAACAAESAAPVENTAKSTDPLTVVTHSVNWGDPIAQFDNGSLPSAALGGAASGAAWEIEVHQGGPGDLWASSGVGALSGTQPLGSASFYAHGYAPAIATLNTGNSGNPDAIEVHQAGANEGALWYDMAAISSTGVVTWYEAWNYDNGFAPHVAALGGYVVEVHQAQQGVGPLWYHFGTIAPNATNVSWGTVAQYDAGTSPSVALVSTSNGIMAVEVHASGSGALWYHFGAVTSTGVNWGPSMQYDYGYAPSVAVADGYIVEAHQAQNGEGALWSNFASISGTTLSWTGATQYDNGYSPSLAWDSVTHTGVEVHAADVGTTALWSHDYHLDTTVTCTPRVCPLNTCGTMPNGCGGTMTCSGCCSHGEIWCGQRCAPVDLCDN